MVVADPFYRVDPVVTSRLCANWDGSRVFEVGPDRQECEPVHLSSHRCRRHASVTAYHHLTSGWGTLDKTRWTRWLRRPSAHTRVTGEILPLPHAGTHSRKTGVVQPMPDWDERHPRRRPCPLPAATLLTAARTVANACTSSRRSAVRQRVRGGGEARRRRGWPSASPRASSRRLQRVTAGTAGPRFTGRQYMRIQPAYTADEDERDQVHEVAAPTRRS